MVQCSACDFRTKYPGGKMCWRLEPPLCGDCAYQLDSQLDKKFSKLEKNRIIKKFLKEEVIPILLKYKQTPNYKFYKKTYIRKPSTRGGRLGQKSSSKGTVTITQDA